MRPSSATRSHGPLKRRRAAFALLALLAAASPSCARPFAEGGSRELVLVSAFDSDAPECVLLSAVVEREAVRIEHEKAYEIRRMDAKDPRLVRARLVIFAGAGPFDRIPPVARPLRAGLEASGGPFAFAPDLWRRGQVVGIVWTETRGEWIPALAREQNRFFHHLDRGTFATVRARVRSLPRNEPAERALESTLGISMRVPRSYVLHLDSRRGAALLVDEGPPARLLRIQRVPAGPRADLPTARAALARLFRPGERTLAVEEPRLTPQTVAGAVSEFYGRWEEEGVSAAGPFHFYEVVRGGRRYYIDLAVFAPGRPKLPYLRELHAIAETLGS